MLKWRANINFYLSLFAGALCLLFSFYFDVIKENFGGDQQNKVGYRTAKREEENKKVLNLFRTKLDQEILQMQKIFDFVDDDDFKNKNKNTFSFQIYKSDSLVCWNSNAIENLPVVALAPYRIQILNNGIFLIGSKRINDRVYVLFYLIRNNFHINNNYLKNTLNPLLNINYPCEIDTVAQEGYNKVALKDGVTFYVLFDISGNSSSMNLWLFLVGMSLLCFALKHALGYFFEIDYVLGLSLLLLLGIMARLLMVSFHYPQYIYNSDLFNPHYFASSDFLPSFGDLMITTLFLGAGILASNYYLNKLKRLEKFKISRFSKAVLLLYIFSSAFFTFKLIHDFVVDSKISFDLTNVFDLSWFSLGGVLIIILIYLVTINLAHVLSQEYIKNKSFRFKNALQIAVVWGLLASYIIFQNENLNWVTEKFLTATLFLLLLVIVRRFFALKSFVVRHLTYALIFANVAAVSFYNDGNEKELEDLILYATRLTTQIDYKAEELLKLKEKEIRNDELFLDSCIKGTFTNTRATQYLTDHYIHNYLEKYQCNVFLFINDSSSITAPNYSFKDFDTIFKNQGLQGLCSNFRFVKSPFEFFGYIGKFELKKQNTNLKIYVLLKLQPYQEDNLLPILIADKSTSFKRNKLHYSYAIYNNNKLMQQAGVFQYQTQNNFENITSHYQLITKNNVSHLLYKDSEDLLVVVSSPPASLLSVLANALCLYIITLFAGVLLLFFDFLFRTIFQTPAESNILKKVTLAWLITCNNYDLLHFKFSTRIVINILGLVLFIFTATSVFTIRYIDFKIGEEARLALIGKLKSINKYFNDDPLVHANFTSREGEENVQKAAALFASDINIYDEWGKIHLSSKPEIFKEGLLSNNINFTAFHEIVYNKASLFAQNETIGELQYTSYYQPYYDKDRNLKYIINTPYFTRTLEYNAQISMFIINFLNLYVALLIIMFIIAVWVARGTTQPFILLREKIKALRLDKENELLTWQRNDEIGELIKQYNSMVLDLKESKQNLSNAERTEAWREMAKQVAHDIKNPLTPMKLNLQFLQKAVEDNDDNLHLKIKSVSKSLIQQVDSLTEMANKFSNFAKVPDAAPQLLNLNEEVEQITELYRATDFVAISTKLIAQEALVWMDKNHFSRALGNIIKNAIQSIPQGKNGKIEISLSLLDEFWLITIIDNGVGIPKAMEHLIFVPNFSTKSSGTGIGLSITKMLVENAGGTISFSTSLGEGATFYLKLPVYHNT